MYVFPRKRDPLKITMEVQTLRLLSHRRELRSDPGSDDSQTVSGDHIWKNNSQTVSDVSNLMVGALSKVGR